ncbi:MAG TPA: lipid II flippase MurJ, partial [Tepidisphaeraceae bacterium]|nr:lipid II flippase MurJ [Tepidisphaeraceae bacterium]
VFAIALATAIFPKLAGDADTSGPIAPTDSFRDVLRRGIEASLFIGLPASIGMILVARPAIELLFRHGQFTAEDAARCALSTAIYSGAIWAFSLLQIINRACYALHDTRTPLIWTLINLIINIIVEIPLVWTGLGESGMAIGTLVSFTIQAIVMTLLVARRAGVDLRQSFNRVLKMIVATVVMGAVCFGIDRIIGWSDSSARLIVGARLVTIMVVGGATYLLCVVLLKLPVGSIIKRRTVT